MNMLVEEEEVVVVYANLYPPNVQEYIFSIILRPTTQSKVVTIKRHNVVRK